MNLPEHDNPGTPLWARLVGYGIAGTFFGWLGLKWGLIVAAPIIVVTIAWYRVKTGHWPR